MFQTHTLGLIIILFMMAKFDQLDAMEQKEESAQDDEDEFTRSFKKLNIKDNGGNPVKGNLGDYRDLWTVIKKYKELRSDNRPAARAFINIIRFNTLSFFVNAMRDEEVLLAILQSIKAYPDKAIKLYFYCLEYECLGLLDEDFIHVIEDIIKDAINFHGDKFTLRFINFYRHWKSNLPRLEVRMYGGGWVDCYEDLSSCL